MKRVLFAATLALLPTIALAQAAPSVFTMALTDDDAKSLRTICDFARTSGQINLETASNVSNYCLALIKRMGDAQQVAAQKAADEAKKKEEEQPPKK